MGRSSVFSLEQIYRKQVVGTWSKIPEVFRYVNSLASNLGTDYGYWGGGNNPSSPGGLSTVDRVDFTNDTATAATKGPLTDSYYWRGGTSSLTHGYIAGAYAPSPNVPTNNRIDYANDTATAATKGPLSAAVQYRVATGNTSYGYWGSGRQGSPFVSSVDRLDYANDTATMSPKGPLVASHNYRMATGNLSYGYWSGGGGNGPPSISSVDRLDYSSDTTTAVAKGTLSSTRYKGAATGNGDYGYIAGGTPSPYKSSIDRIDYSNDTATAASGKGPLSIGRVNFGDAATGTNDYGYWGGGFKAYANISTIDRLDYSSDTSTASVKGPMTLIRARLAAVGSRAYGFPTVNALAPATRTESEPISPALLGTNFGYWTAGYHPGPTSIIDRLDFDNDTNITVAKGPLSRTSYNVGTAGNKPYGYVAAGSNPEVSTVDRIDYGNDTATTAVKGPLTVARRGAKGVGNLSYGYFGGGEPGPFSTVDRVDYSNDTAAAAPKGPMSSARRRQGSVSNLSYGYIAGGPSNSTVDRIDFSNDTATATTKAPLSSGKQYVMGAGTNAYGYFAGGSQPNFISTIDRLDYASDTTAMVPTGPLHESQWAYGGGTGNASYAYFGGGYDSADPISFMARLDYANDTATTVDKGKLTYSRYNLDAVSSRGNAQSSPTSKTVDKGADGYQTNFPSNFGYHAGGIGAPDPNYFSNVDRINYSNDTATAVTKGSLTRNTSDSGSTGNTSYGYYAAGGPGAYSDVQRLDYGNDTATASPKGNLAEAGTNSEGVGNASYGYNNTGPAKTLIQRIDFGNDTATATPKGPLTNVSYVRGAAGNQSYGYMAGGYPFNTIMNRIDYADDTSTALAKGPLANPNMYALAAAGNSSYGYFAGGGPNSYVNRLDYSNDSTTTSPKGNLSSSKSAVQGAGTADYGYIVGGKEGGPEPVSTVDRIDFANDTATATTKGPLTAVRRYAVAASARNNALPSSGSFIPRIRWVDSASPAAASVAGPAFAYWLGGDDGDTTWYSIVDRVDYSNDTVTATPKGSLDDSKRGGGGVSSKTHGYAAGGSINNSGDHSSKVSRIDYANDTATASTVGNLATTAAFNGAVGNTSYGYINIGTIPSGTTKIERIDYSSDSSTATPKGNLDVVRMYLGAAGNQSYGYFGGGFGPGYDGPHSTVQRIEYASDTSTASPKGPLSYTRNALSAASNASYVYFGGGFNPVSSQVSRIDISNDTPTAVDKGSLNTGRFALEATGTTSFGYFGGGRTPSIGSVVDRIDYSNDTATASPKGPLSAARRYCPAVSALANAFPQTTTAAVAAPVQPPFPYPQQLPAPSPGHGYWSGGLNNATSNPATSEIGRIDFSNDTATTALKGNMHTGRSNHSAIGNQTHVYSGGGGNPAESPSYLSSIERMTFANDTATSVDKSTFRAAFTSSPSPGQGANYAVSVGNLSYGYWQGANNTYVDRLDYSNDTAQAAAHTNSSIDNGGRASVGNLSYGYMCGGWISKSTVDRLDYGNDTATLSPKGNLEAPLAQTFGVGNGSYGYIISGRDPSLPTYRTSITRIDFADDTSTSSPKGNLAGTSYKGGGTGNASYGYVIEAQNDSPSFGYYTRIYRIDYSNDTATAPAVSNFSYPGRSMKGFSGRAYGLPN